MQTFYILFGGTFSVLYCAAHSFLMPAYRQESWEQPLWVRDLLCSNTILQHCLLTTEPALASVLLPLYY